MTFMTFMTFSWRLLLIILYVLAIKGGWEMIPAQADIEWDLMDEFQSILEVEAINSAQPYQYHLQIDN